MDANKIMSIANRSKDMAFEEEEDYALANAAFAVLLQKWITEEDSGLSVEIQSEVPEGRDVENAYYDLVVLRTPKGGELCIPLPLLKAEAIVTLAKRGVPFVERPEHNREHREASQAERDALWAELLREVQPGMLGIESACAAFLQDELLIPVITQMG